MQSNAGGVKDVSAMPARRKGCAEAVSKGGLLEAGECKAEKCAGGNQTRSSADGAWLGLGVGRAWAQFGQDEEEEAVMG